MDILGMILGDGIGSRLQKKLITESQLVQDIYVGHYSQELAGEFEISATLTEEKNFDNVYNKILSEITLLSETNVNENEISIAKNKFRLSINRQIEKSGGFGGIADTLNYINIFGENPSDINKILNDFNNVSQEKIATSAKSLVDSPHISLYYKIKK